MKKFLDDNFLLETKTAEILFHEYAKKMPIIDYHSHLIPEQITDNKQFENLTQPWLYGDHYKWRAMRTNGIDEKYCTGNASDWEKFEKWAETVPYTLRNPLYHWTHLELKEYFGIETLLNKESAKIIYGQTKELLQSELFKVHGLLKKMNVELVCTTDDPTDSLEHHQKIANGTCEVKVLPTWRPDKAMAVDNLVTYNAYLDILGKASDTVINKFEDLLKALCQRHDFFHKNGCRLSDHGIEIFYAEDYNQPEITSIFNKIRSKIGLSKMEILKFKSAMLYEFGIMDYAKSWTQQFHVGPIRNNNTRLFNKLGPDTGFDSIGDFSFAQSMSKFLDRLDREDKLTKTIIYNINPNPHCSFFLKKAK